MSTTLIENPSAPAARPHFGTFLRRLRRRVPPTAVAIGRCQRPLVRCGRRVTQEEAAELVGVSRTWYRLLESGARVRASLRVLERLADVFTLTPDERRELFVLALPELDEWLGRPSLTEHRSD